MKALLAGKKILITGGTSALGQCIVKQALQNGAEVFATYQKNHKLAESLSSLGADLFSVDLNDRNSLLAMVKSVLEKTNSLDVIIHNAATTRDKTLQNMTEEDWDLVMEANVTAPFLLTQKLQPLLLKASSRIGKVFFLTSRMATSGGYGIANYAASKAASVALMKSLAAELGPQNILVNAVNPGFMKSSMTADISETGFQKNLALSHLHKISDPEEVAKFFVWLSSDEMTQVSGQTLHFEARKSFQP